MWPGAGRAEVASSPWPVASPQPNSPWNRANGVAPGDMASREGRSVSQHPTPVGGHHFAVLSCCSGTGQGRGGVWAWGLGLLSSAHSA